MINKIGALCLYISVFLCYNKIMCGLLHKFERRKYNEKTWFICEYVIT